MALLVNPKTSIIFASFFLFGLINNSLYVVILSAASDLVGPKVPKALVLLFDVAPSFMIKLTAPFFIEFIPYCLRIYLLVFLSTFGMVIISLNSGEGNLFWKMFGVVLASLSSGLGEITFLSMTHYYQAVSLNAWSSGTGFAGIFGSFNFMVMTIWLGFSTKSTLLLFSILPFAFFGVFWKLLPKIDGINDIYWSSLSYTSKAQSVSSVDTLENGTAETENLLLNNESYKTSLQTHILDTIQRIRPLIIPYMIPLTSVYFAEYVINQGVSPTLLFPIEETPFEKFRDIYVTYATLYQIGVFISRSSAPFYRVYKLYYPATLQMVNLFICIAQSMSMFIPNINLMFLLIFYEGLLGGAAYVNTFMLITEEVPLDKREFTLGTVSIADSLGVAVASLFGMWAETSLCKYQVNHGRDWCTLK